MSATTPEPDAAPEPPDEAPKTPRNRWIWVSAGLPLVAAGLLIWALTLRSDVHSAQDETRTAEQELTSSNQ
jgi:hypothetical protein